MIRRTRRRWSADGRRRPAYIAAVGAFGLLATLAGCGDTGSEAESGGCEPADLVWVYGRITDPDSHSYPGAIFRLQDGSETRLTDDDAAGSPSVSPDGSQIVFDRGSEGDPESAGYSRYRLYVMDSDGGDEQPMLDPAYEVPDRDDGAPSWDTNPVWSPDGSRIAFVRNTGFTESRVKPEDVHAVMVAPADGGKPRPLPGGASDLHDPTPAWSPDGRRLAWLAEASRTLYWARVDGTDPGTVRLRDAFGTPAWTEGGKAIVVPSTTDPYGDDGDTGLYRVDIATGEHTEVATDPLTDVWALPTGQLAGIEPDGEDASKLAIT